MGYNRNRDEKVKRNTARVLYLTLNMHDTVFSQAALKEVINSALPPEGKPVERDRLVGVVRDALQEVDKATEFTERLKRSFDDNRHPGSMVVG